MDQPAFDVSVFGVVTTCKKRITRFNPYVEIRSLCVKWDLGENVSRIHLGDRSTVEWPLNSITALFIWNLIDEAVIFIHSLLCQVKQIFAWFLIVFPFLTNTHASSIWNRSIFRLVINNGVITLRATLFCFLQFNNYSALMSLLHLREP